MHSVLACVPSKNYQQIIEFKPKCGHRIRLQSSGMSSNESMFIMHQKKYEQLGKPTYLDFDPKLLAEAVLEKRVNTVKEQLIHVQNSKYCNCVSSSQIDFLAHYLISNANAYSLIKNLYIFYSALETVCFDFGKMEDSVALCVAFDQNPTVDLLFTAEQQKDASEQIVSAVLNGSSFQLKTTFNNLFLAFKSLQDLSVITFLDDYAYFEVIDLQYKSGRMKKWESLFQSFCQTTKVV